MANLLQGDCAEKMRDLADNSIDAIVTDPHYHAIASRRIAEAKPLPPTATQEELPL